jgi:hypothetical protein
MSFMSEELILGGSSHSGSAVRYAPLNPQRELHGMLASL